MVVVGVILTGVPDGLARYPPIGWVSIAAAFIVAAAVGALVMADERADALPDRR